MARLLQWLLSLACVACIRVSAESYTTNVIDGVATNIPGLFILGDSGPYNVLIVTNAGLLTTERTTVGNTNEAHSNTAIVTGIGSLWRHSDALWLGLHSASNRLLVLNGGDISTESVIGIGTYATAIGNLLHISGAGSAVTGASLYLGTYGAQNEFLMEAGSFAQLGTVILNSEGNAAGGQQSLRLRGSNTWLAVTNFLQIGNSPSNTVYVGEGARLTSRSTTIGQGAASRGNRVEISGTGTLWLNSFDTTIGASGSSNNAVTVADAAEARPLRVFLGQSTSENVFNVAAGGSLDAGQVTVGDQMRAWRNYLRVTGPGTTLSNSGGLTIGNYGVGNGFVLSNGAFAQTRSAGIGMQYTSSNNYALATGTGTVWAANQLIVGSAGRYNRLEVADGAQVFAGSLLSGGQGGLGNTTRVHGATSLLSITNSLDLSGGNTLLVTNHARVASGGGVVGSYGPSNTAMVAHGTWTNAGSLDIGFQSGRNRLVGSEVARLYSSNAVIGGSDLADFNRVELTGKGTFWRLRNELTLGSWGDSNQLTVANVASLSARNLNVGGVFVPAPPALFPSDGNLLLIQGTNTDVNISSNLSLGYFGVANGIEVRAGATLTSDRAEVAVRANSARNGILVTDPFTLWHNTNRLVLGSNGYGSTLIVSNGARLRTGEAVLGDGGVLLQVTNQCSNYFGFNHAIVTGTNTVWESGSQLTVGRISSSNSVTVTRGASLRAHDLNIGRYGFCGPSDVNTFVLDGGMLIVSNRLFNAPQGLFRMFSGRAEVNGVFVEGGPPGRFKVLGGLLRPGSLYASAPAEIEIGDGVRQATLELIGGNYFSSGRIIVASNSVIAGRGSIAGVTNAGTFGTLRAVTAMTNAALTGSSGFDVWIQGPGAGVGHSVLVTPPFPQFNPTTVSGRLRVALTRVWQPSATDEFPIVLFGSPVGGEFYNAPHNARLKTVDNLASFLVLYSSNRVVLTGYQSTDLDGDAIEDAWANTYFGHSPLTALEKSGDADGDGASNQNEFVAGTDPTDADSALRVTASVANGIARLRWPTVEGKTYGVYVSSNMRQWREVADPTFSFPAPVTCEWTDDGKESGSASAALRFYRVAVK